MGDSFWDRESRPKIEDAAVGRPCPRAELESAFAHVALWPGARSEHVQSYVCQQMAQCACCVKRRQLSGCPDAQRVPHLLLPSVVGDERFSLRIVAADWDGGLGLLGPLSDSGRGISFDRTPRFWGGGAGVRIRVGFF